MNLNPVAQKVLVFLADEYSEDYGCFGFSGIIDGTGIDDRKAVRRACRLLARKGLARYVRTLWSDDGEPRGAGYGATKEGIAICADWPRPCRDCGQHIAEAPRFVCEGCEAYREHQQ